MATATSFLHHPKVMLSYSYILCTSSLHHFYIISTSFLHHFYIISTSFLYHLITAIYGAKEHLNFMNGWSILEAAMSVSVPTGELSSLFVDDPVVSFDNLLNDLINYND
ncbi:hypothetical protein F5888DRAFT_1639716 [Russula emetica]|nr:hypothetical protein F5888DRAFT_1639716 [Russula emetica]